MPIRKEFGDSKVCRDCNQEKPLSEYYKPKSRNTHFSYCRVCQVERTRKWQKSNPEKFAAAQKRSRRRNQYKMTNEEIAYADSKGACEVCGETEKLVVDHCHEKVKFRGVLCSRCNHALGHARDSVEILEALIDYLRRNT